MFPKAGEREIRMKGRKKERRKQARTKELLNGVEYITRAILVFHKHAPNWLSEKRTR